MQGATGGEDGTPLFYFGAASGSSRKALRRLSEPCVMINYATKNNKPWYGIEKLFIDSGGYSFMKGKGEYETTNEEYASWLLDHDPEVFALRDYPCEPEILEKFNRTVADHQQMTTERHCELWDLVDPMDGQRVSVVQGWAKNQYVEHVDQLRDQGVLADYVGIGSVCGRKDKHEVRRIILAVADALPSGTDIHAFGIKSSVLQFPDVRDALTSADSQSFDVEAQWGTLKDVGAGSKTWRDSALEYLRQRRRIQATLAGNEDETKQQQTLPTADGEVGISD